MTGNIILPSFPQILLEAPEDGADTGGADEGFGAAPADEGGDTAADDAATDDTGGEEDAGADDTPNEDNDDFAIDAEDDIGGGDEGGGDTAGSDSGGNNDNPAEVDNADKKRDREIYDSLSPEEQKLKNVTLKKNFVALYDRCTQISEKLDDVGVEFEELIPTTKRALDALFDLKEMISSYLLYLYDSNSYVENDIYFNRCLTIMNNIKLITRDMKKVVIETEKN